MVNLKRLELQGFKSFAGKTVINFENSFTDIVGPNGCGKSNVADAVRWVLGEMSAKALRGSKMQDVIFNGTEKRPSMSYCEVSLVFDNSNHIFKTDREEVIVTRKIYRTGNSEYYLNNNIARLRDIIDIMRDTGAGKDGYSIIGQGKVAEIMNSKPIDRRQIFEEAAGIAKTKAEKIETERKLKSAGEDIARMQDIANELEHQLAPLAKQRDAAQKFFEYKEQMRFQEVNYYLYSRESSVKKKEQIAANVKAYTEELSAKESESIKLAAQHNDCLAMIDGAEKDMRALMEEREHLKVSNEKNSGLMAVHKSKVDALTADKERLEKETVEHESALQIASVTLDEAKNIFDIRSQEAYIAEQRVNSLNNKYFELSQEIAGNESSIERSNSEVFDVFGRLSDVKSSLAGFTAEAGSLSSRKASLQDEIASCGAIITREEDQKQKSFDKVNELTRKKRELRENRAILMGEFNDDKQNLYNLNLQLTSMTADYASKEGRVRAMAEIVSQHESYQPAVKYVLNDAQKDRELASHIEGVIGQLIKVPKEYEVAIEAALGASVQHIVTPTDTDAIHIVNYLKSHGYGIATMIPLNKARPQDLAIEYRGVLNMRGCIGICSQVISYKPQYDDVIAQLLGRTVIAENLEYAREMANRYDYGVKIVTLEGDIIDPRRTITGGSRKQGNAYHLSKERELNDAQEALKKLFIDRENKRKEVEMLDKSSKAKEEKIYAMRDEMQNADLEIVTAQERMATADKLIAETSERMLRLQTEFDELEVRLSTIQKEIKQAEGLNKDIEGKKQSAQGIAKASKEEIGNKRKLRDSIASALTNAQVELSSVQLEISQINTDIKRLENEVEEEKRILADKRVNLNATNKALETEKNSAPELELTLQEKARIEQIEKEMQLKDMQKVSLKVKLTETDAARDAVNEQINLIMDKRAREESKVEKIDGDLVTLREKVLGEYELSEEQMLALRDEENFNPSEAHSAISSLKGKITQLGSINFNAFDDYEQVKTRHEELTVQLQDLAKAKDDLEKLIADMTKDMTNKFNIAFEQINQNFKKTFSDLFGGGNAELMLVEVEDEEDKGVDINVKLPGKTHQNLHLLSGGEQALTSIAILFAILRLRPMPFSILDEIDAALDESNALLLANYLKKYSRDTQFIVITHKKPVMECADALFGVTMEERGVSKVITVKIGDAIARAEE